MITYYDTCKDCGKDKTRNPKIRCRPCSWKITIYKRTIPIEVKEQLTELIKTNTLQELGDRFGVSRERIRQLLNKQGVKVRDVRVASRKQRCATSFCPNLIRVGLHFNIEGLYCTTCRAYRKRAIRTKIYTRKHEPKTMCLKHPEVRAKVLKPHPMCHPCRINWYSKTPKGVVARKKYMSTHRKERNAYLRAYVKKYSMSSPSDKGFGYKHNSIWLTNYFTARYD